MTVKEISGYINEIAPYNTACSWDNCGILVGSPAKEVGRIAFALDLTSETVSYAKENGADLIITHHPAIFNPRKNFLDNDPVYKAAVEGMSVIAAHTCFDCADGGVNDVLSSILQLEDVFKIPGEDCVVPMVRAGRLKEAMSPRDFAKFVAEKLGTTVRFVDGGKEVKTVAVCGGAGMSFAADLAEYNVDAYVTGEIRHHEMLDSKESGLTVVAAGHFETEYPAMSALKKMVEERFAGVSTVLVPQSRPVEYIG